MKLIWYVAVGSALGGVTRYAFNGLIQARGGAGFPTATLVINVSGSLLLGVIMRYALQSGALTPEFRALTAVGFCGGYTTFSTFTFETVTLITDGEYGRASLYVGLSVVLGLAGVLAGFALANLLLPPRTPM